MTSSGLFTLFGSEVLQTFEPDKKFTLFGAEVIQTFEPDKKFTLFGIEILQTGVFSEISILPINSNIPFFINGGPNSESGIPLYTYGNVSINSGIPLYIDGNAPPSALMSLYTTGPCGTGYFLRESYLITSDSFNRSNEFLNDSNTDIYLGGRVLPWQSNNLIVSGEVVEKYSNNITASGSQGLLWSNSYDFVDLRCTVNTYPNNSVGLLARARPQGGQFRDGILYTINTVIEDGFPLTRGRIYKRTADNSLTASFSLLSAGSEISDIPITGYMRMVASGNNIIGYFNDTPITEYNSISNPNIVYNLVPNTGLGIYVNNANFNPSEPVYLDNFQAYGNEYFTYESECFTNEIPLYIGASDVNNTGIPLFMPSSTTETTGIPLYVSGIFTDNQEILLYIKGLDYASTGIPLYTFGVFRQNSGIPLYTENYETKDSGIPLFTNGVFSNSTGIPLYIYGKDSNNDNIPLYISSFSSSGNGAITLYIGDLGNRIERGMTLYLKNPGAFSGLPLVVWGEGYSVNPDTNEGGIPSQGSIHLYIEGQGSYANMPMYLYSQEGLLNNNINLSINSNENVNTGIPLFIDSIDVKNDNLPLYSHGF